MQIFRLKERILGEESFTVGICCKQFQNTANSDPHPPDTRLAATLTRFDRYSIKDGFHLLSLDYAYRRKQPCRFQSA